MWLQTCVPDCSEEVYDLIMVITVADISLNRALQSKKKKKTKNKKNKTKLTFTDHLLLVIAVPENEELLSTFSIRRLRIRVADMTCKC